MAALDDVPIPREEGADVLYHIASKDTPSEEVEDLGLPECPPSEGESMAGFSVVEPFAPRFCVSITLIFGRAMSDMATQYPCARDYLRYHALQCADVVFRPLPSNPGMWRRWRGRLIGVWGGDVWWGDDG